MAKKIRNSFKFLGSALAVADLLKLLDLFFFIKSGWRIRTRAERGGVEVALMADNRTELFRGKRFFTKEPDTISWIEERFRPGDIFFDIGANIGVFSLYAAKRVPGVQVYSFEPFGLNFAKLNENISLNRLDDKIVALPIAVGGGDTISRLNVSEFAAGASGSQYEGTSDYLGNPFVPAFSQGCVGFSLDSLVLGRKLPQPNHMKIDVDGNEALILENGKGVLADRSLASVLVELSSGPRASRETDAASRRVMDLLRSYGFGLDRVSEIGTDTTSRNYLFIRR